MKTTSEITGKTIDFETKHLALMVSDELWQHDKWMIILDGGRITSEYSTGTGHRVALRQYGCRERFKTVMSKQYKQDKENLITVNKRIEACSKPVAPNLDDILYSLVMDSSAIDETFEDWCADFGYDEDSIKANETYRACQKSAKTLKQLGFNDLDALRDMFQDY